MKPELVYRQSETRFPKLPTKIRVKMLLMMVVVVVAVVARVGVLPLLLQALSSVTSQAASMGCKIRSRHHPALY
jgi:type III secretory pathway component EscS|tara:strand:+ start:219 stop:440 length:222 start_codon:yes stop_codon:yes gene_type:complete